MNFKSFFAIVAAASVVVAVPTVKRSTGSTKDVWTPKVTSPKAGDQLQVGETYTVTWDTSDAPSQITNTQGAIVLRKGQLTTSLVLAGNFPITRGFADVTIPWLLSDEDYTFVLFGDSGNYSPTFSIQGPSPFSS